jgi:hypothetical protein
VGLLKRKAEKTVTIWIRLPISAKSELDTLREIADRKGFDLTVSLTDWVLRWIKQVREELSESPAHKREAAEKGSGVLTNGRGE